MMHDNRVFIVVPVYNVEAFLPRCVDSLLKQTHPNVQIVLVEDGTKDSSGEICDRYAANNSSIHVIHKPNGGLSDARNAGLAYCMAQSQDYARDYIAMVDSDDFVHEDFVARLLAICEENGCEGAQCAYEHGGGDAFTLLREPRLEVTDGTRALLGYRIKSVCHSKLYRLAMYEDESFRVGMINEDEFMTYRLVYKCSHFAFTDEALYYYYERPGSIMDQMRNNIRDNPHRYDWLLGFTERAAFFETRGERQLEQRTYEKVCIELILRYTEQMALPADKRDRAIAEGQYLRAYRNAYRRMISLETIPLKRKAIYTLFRFLPLSAVLLSRLHPLRG